jgi:hypothetical protein
LLFSEAPSSGTNNIYVIYRDQPVQSITDTGAVRRTGDIMTGNLTLADNTNAMFVEIHNGTNWTGRYTASAIGKSALQYYNGSAWVDGLQLDSIGRINIPYQPMFSGYRNTSPSTVSAGSVIIHNVVLTDIGSCYNQSTGRFTCPVAGKYMVYIGAHGENTAPLRNGVRKNGTIVVEEYSSGPTGHYGMVGRMAILTCAAGDYLENYTTLGTLWCGDTTGATFTVNLIA